ncbi:hypothetical protein LRP88_03551 [Fusarium phalaenopsidis]
MTTTETPECVQGYQTYTMTAVASAPANADSIRVFIPEADRPGMKWEVSLPTIQFFGIPIDVRGNIRSWRVGTSDERTTLASGDGGKDMSIKWETPRDTDGTYVELFFTSNPPLGPQVFRVVAQSDGWASMPSHCNDPPTIVSFWFPFLAHQGLTLSRPPTKTAWYARIVHAAIQFDHKAPSRQEPTV